MHCIRCASTTRIERVHEVSDSKEKPMTIDGNLTLDGGRGTLVTVFKPLTTR